MPEIVPSTTRFVILAAPRSGSNLLCTLLGSHPEVLCHHEVFNPSGIFYALDYRDGSFDLGTIEERDLAPLAFLERLWSLTLNKRHVGFKMTRGQNEDALLQVLADPHIRKIVLKRRNRIKTFVSNLVAERSGQWEVYNTGDLLEPRPQVELDLVELHRHMAENDAYYTRIESSIGASGQRAVAIDYEDLGSPAEHARLLADVGVKSGPVQLMARSIKQNPTDLRRLVANFNDVMDALRGTDLIADLCSSNN